MNVRSALLYTVLRLAVFLVPFGILMLLPIGREFYWLSAIFAALIGLSLSVLFLRKPLADATAGLGPVRRSGAQADEDAEDAVADVAYGETPITPQGAIASDEASADARRAADAGRDGASNA